jgi:hypothetical protein
MRAFKRRDGLERRPPALPGDGRIKLSIPFIFSATELSTTFSHPTLDGLNSPAHRELTGG